MAAEDACSTERVSKERVYKSIRRIHTQPHTAGKLDKVRLSDVGQTSSQKLPRLPPFLWVAFGAKNPTRIASELANARHRDTLA
ncbi:unnamed protein product [Protopolystoma xenopodis]|uniref:Uncharacterized protein n=1 Tax=Protopolystoma xenopodis TaxID=117903 RepID=A0A3S4ZUE4_9PLAT|nr:unnamed protein product [Protopolystoma xenopodis]